MRAGLRIGPDIKQANEDTLVLAMIETPEGIANAEEIAAVPGIDGLYIGPADLAIALGGTLNDPTIEDQFAAALERIRDAAQAAGKIAAAHTSNGQLAAKRVAEGFTFVTIANDLMHAEQIARSHLETARKG
jgi:4-hydroxy-2-oxoheptanedioate aldolase